MVLVNGAEGIGTGWMTKIPNHNPRQIVEILKSMLQGEEPVRMVCSIKFTDIINKYIFCVTLKKY